MLHSGQFPENIRRNYTIDSLAALFKGLFTGLVITFTAVTLRRLQAGDIAVAFVAVGPMIANSFNLLWAYISGRKDKILWTVLPTIFSRGILVFCFFIKNPLHLGILLFIHFFSEAIHITPYSSVMKEIYPDDCRSQAMGYVHTVFIASTLTGAALGGRLLDAGGLYSYTWVFPLGGILGVVSSLIFWNIKLPPEKKCMTLKLKRIQSVSQSVKNIVTSLPLLQVVSVNFIVGFANLLGMAVFPLYQVDILHLSNTSVGILGVLISLGGVAFLYRWGRVKSGRVNFNSFRKILFLVPAILILYSTAGNIYPLCIASFISGTCWNGWHILWFNYLVQSTGSDMVAKGYVGVRYTLMGVRSLLVPLLISFIGDVRLTLYVAIIIALIGLILSLNLKDEVLSREFGRNG